jgi:hypothetical protein
VTAPALPAGWRELPREGDKRVFVGDAGGVVQTLRASTGRLLSEANAIASLADYFAVLDYVNASERPDSERGSAP